METTRACSARAKAHGLKFSIENHNHTLLPDTGSFLRLWESIRDPDLGIESRRWLGVAWPRVSSGCRPQSPRPPFESSYARY